MITSIAEPSLTHFNHVFSRYFFATRPNFLLATLAACLLGIASAKQSGIALHAPLVLITVMLALLVHAAVNVLNDYYDDANGADELNTERLYPFTGGSRFIQNGLLTPEQTGRFGYGLLGISILGGLWLIFQVGIGLLVIGGVGIFIGWAYSASTLRLNSRGLGELSVLIGFLGLVIGADFVQRRTFSLQPVIVGMSYALLVTNLLFINQFPDRKSDALAGKRHWVVRLPLPWSVRIYPILAGLVLIWLVAMVKMNELPLAAMISALPLLFSVRAAWLLKQFASEPARLRPAIQLTLAAMLGHAFLLAFVLFWES
jgi:1,4-dihydroxy-2-naphthoate polyprenyltransferase